MVIKVRAGAGNREGASGRTLLCMARLETKHQRWLRQYHSWAAVLKLRHGVFSSNDIPLCVGLARIMFFLFKTYMIL